jgi:hypothetical protein
MLGNRLDRILGENPPPVNDEEKRLLGAGALRPLATFPFAEKALADVVAPLAEDRWASPESVSDADLVLTRLSEELQKIRDLLGEKLEYDRVTGMLDSLIRTQERLKAERERWQREMGDLLRSPLPTLGPVGPVLLNKGEARKVRHTISWNQFAEDTLTVKVTASDPSVVVPTELKLTFEGNQESFEYEVRAGQKEGEYAITLTPQAGKPVKVQVTVK